MKKYIITFILLLMPFVVKAEMRKLELIDQYNTGYSEIYYMGDYFFLTNSVYSEEKDFAFATMDMDGNYLYEHENTNDFRKVIFDHESVYLIYITTENNVSTMYIEKYNPKTGEKIANISINNVNQLGFKYYYRSFDGYLGIESDNDVYPSYVVKKDLSSYEEVTDYDDYTGYYPVNPNLQYISDAENENVYNYLEENHIALNTLSGFSILVGDYYYTLTNPDEREINPNIIIIDKDFKEYDLMPIKNNKLYDGSKFSKDGLYFEEMVKYNDKLLVTFRYKGSCQKKFDPSNRFGTSCAADSYVQVYKVFYNIYTKTDGNGEVKVSQNTADGGEGVTFEVIPKEGYVLSEVKVTDALGNVIVFTDYKFTMPTADVTIEAVFVKAATNPNTKDLIGLFITIIVLSLITFVYNFVNKERKETI